MVYIVTFLLGQHIDRRYRLVVLARIRFGLNRLIIILPEYQFTKVDGSCSKTRVHCVRRTKADFQCAYTSLFRSSELRVQVDGLLHRILEVPSKNAVRRWVSTQSCS